MLSWRYGQTASAVAFLSLTESELTKTESTYLAEMHRQSPKEKASKPPTVRRRKRPHAHLRVPHLEEVMSPVTTPTDEDVGHRIKHVAGVCQVGTGGVAQGFGLGHVPVPRHTLAHSFCTLVIDCISFARNSLSLRLQMLFLFPFAL